jgi:UDP-N-acetylmuramoyl-L-alanyl-D-glutamate--2,6-diaminopimelate ligase
MKLLTEALHYLEYLDLSGKTENIGFDSISYNSSKIEGRTVFVAIRGTTLDGHNFIHDAILNNAKIIICEEYPDKQPQNVVFVRVANSRKALAELSNFFFDFPAKKLKVIGITGTNGKTTTAFLIKSFLEKIGKKTALLGTTGIYLEEKKITATHTTPESLELFGIFRQIADAEIEYVVMEVSSHSLVQYRVQGINFISAIFTNLTHDHLDFHKTMENYALAKKILFDNLSENSVAIVNADDDYGLKMLDNCACGRKYLITRKPDMSLLRMRESAIITIQNEKIKLSGISFSLKFKSEIEKHEISGKADLIGKFNIDNLTYAVSSMYGLDLPLPDLGENSNFLKGAPGRMEVVKLPKGAIGIVDYAHTPDALEKALKTLQQIREQAHDDKNLSRIICIFGCGGNRDKAKRPLMGKIAAEFADIVVITSDNPRNEDPEIIIGEIKSGIPNHCLHKIQVIENRKEAIQLAYSLAKENDMLLVAGKGHEDYQIIGDKKYHFDDREELLDLN